MTSAIFEASSKITNGIFIADLCDALEDIGPIHVNAIERQNDVMTSQNVTIPSVDVNADVNDHDSGVESMSTTFSFESSLPKSDSDPSLNVNKETVNVEDDKTLTLPIISMEEVGDHYAQNDAWMVIYDKVYDFTDFMQEVTSFYLSNQRKLPMIGNSGELSHILGLYLTLYLLAK